MVFVGISGAFSVLFGAWLAHGGQALPEHEQWRLSNALQYQFIHTLALLCTLVCYLYQPSRWLVATALCFCLGILLFSGSLYVKTFLALDVIGKLAPAGGMILALGWVFICFAGGALVAKNR